MCSDLVRPACTCGVDTPKPNGARSQQSTCRLLQNAQAEKRPRAIHERLRSGIGRRMLAGAGGNDGASGSAMEMVIQGGITQGGIGLALDRDALIYLGQIGRAHV